MRNLAATLLTSDSVVMMGIDLSYRDTGVCIAERKRDAFLMREIYNYKNPQTFLGFDGIINSAKLASDTIRRISRLDDIAMPDVIIIELPCYTQKATSAVAIGVIVGACINEFQDHAIFVRPEALKQWSGSKKGDKKKAVASKVAEISGVSHKNDNIIDAVGICCMFNDEITKLKNEEKNS